MYNWRWCCIIFKVKERSMGPTRRLVYKQIMAGFTWSVLVFASIIPNQCDRKFEKFFLSPKQLICILLLLYLYFSFPHFVFDYYWIISSRFYYWSCGLHYYWYVLWFYKWLLLIIFVLLVILVLIFVYF